jgi:cytochrome bd-type quinol oxidase subunit 2
MLNIAAIGLPLALSYVAVVYRLFHGKVELEETRY